MRDNYDFSNAIRNPFASLLSKQTIITIDSDIADYFKQLSDVYGIPYQVLINLYLIDCVKNHRKLDINWK